MHKEIYDIENASCSWSPLERGATMMGELEMAEDILNNDLPNAKLDTPFAGKEHREKLKAEIKRTGVTPRMFFEKKFFLNDRQRPSKLDRRMMNLVLAGKSNQTDQIIIDYIFQKYSSLENDVGRKSEYGKILPRRGRQFPQEGEDWITITKEMLALLVSEFNRTGHNPRTVLSDAHDIPDRLNPRMIQGWYYSDITKTNSVYWNFVIDRLKNKTDYNPVSFPIKNNKPYKISKSRPNYQPILEEVRENLRYQRDRTKVGGAVLLKYAQRIPDDLKPSMITGWLAGNTKTADPENLRYVLELYENTADPQIDLKFKIYPNLIACSPLENLFLTKSTLK